MRIALMPQAPDTISSPQGILIVKILGQGELTQHIFVMSGALLTTIILAVRPEWILEFGLQCGLRAAFGLRCPFCGMTHDFAAILHGHHPTSNPCSWFAMSVIYFVYPLIFTWAFLTNRLYLFHSDMVRRLIVVVLIIMFIMNNA